MDRPSLILGELRGFKEETLRRLEAIEKKVEASVAFKAKVLGMSTLVAFLSTIAVEFFRR